MTTDALGRLQDLLNDLFQKDLDFGIYRIMNHKRREIRRSIEKGVPETVERALEGGVVARHAGDWRARSCRGAGELEGSCR